MCIFNAFLHGPIRRKCKSNAEISKLSSIDQFLSYNLNQIKSNECKWGLMFLYHCLYLMHLSNRGVLVALHSLPLLHYPPQATVMVKREEAGSDQPLWFKLVATTAVDNYTPANSHSTYNYLVNGAAFMLSKQFYHHVSLFL